MGLPIPLSLGICRNLKSIVVQIGIADYFKEPSSPEAQKLFEDMVTKLQVRRWLWGHWRPELIDVPMGLCPGCGWGPPHTSTLARWGSDPMFDLQALRRRPGFSKILHVKVEGGC